MAEIPPFPERDRWLGRIPGRGIEIGAFHSPVRLPAAEAVTYVDAYPPELQRRYFPEIPADLPVVKPEVLAPADRLPMFKDASLDFVVASHLLEHVADPLAALIEWHRVLRPGGMLWLMLPDMRGTFDAARPRTTLDHLVLDHTEPPGAPARDARDLEHFQTWARIVNGLADPGQAAFWARFLRRIGYPIHFHCWEPDDLEPVFGWLAREARAPYAILERAARSDRYEFLHVLRADAGR